MTEIVRPGWIDPRLVFTRASPATRWENGQLQIVPAGTPVFENGAWRMEPAATNLYPWSDSMLLSSFNAGGITTLTQAPGKFGLEGGVRFGDEAGAAYIYRSTAGVIGETWTVSFLLEMEDGSEPRFGVQGTGYVGTIVVDGAIVSEADTIKRRIPGTNLWHVSGTRTITTGGGTNKGLVRYATQSRKPFTVYGLQIEKSGLATATSLVLTAGTTVTRAADNASLTGDAFAEIWGGTEGALFVDLEQYAPSNSSYGDVVIMPAGSVSPRIAINVAATDQPSITWSPVGRRHIGAMPFGTRMRFGFRYRAGYARAHINGLAQTPFAVDSSFDWATMARLFLRTYGGLIRVYRVLLSRQDPGDSYMNNITRV